jgi:hypothetical protein
MDFYLGHRSYGAAAFAGMISSYVPSFVETAISSGRCSNVVEFFVLRLLLGIEPRHQLLFGFYRRRIRRKLLGTRLQMTNWRVTVHREPGASDRSSIADGIARNEGAAEDCYGDRMHAAGLRTIR